MSKKKDLKSNSSDRDEMTILALIQQLNAESATPEKKVLAMLLFQKLARSSRASFKKYWPSAISVARELVRTRSASLQDRAVAHGLLSFDHLLRFDFAKAEQSALKALKEGNSLAQYCLFVCRHLTRKKIRLNKGDVRGLMTEIDNCLLKSATVERQIAQHQCYLCALHLGLLHDQDGLAVKAKQYLQDIGHP